MVASGEISIGASLINSLKLGIFSQFTHSYGDDGVYCMEHDAASNPFEMGSCDKAQKTPFGFYFPIVSQIVGQDSGDFIIGVSKEAHVGLGFHVSAGINIDAFIELMSQG